MSSIIRFSQFSPGETKIIQTKKIEKKKPAAVGQEIDAEQQKQVLLHDIEALENRFAQLQSELKMEQEHAHAKMARWRQDQQEQAEQQAQQLAKEASEQGFQAGFEQGKLQAEEEFRQKRQEMHELVETAYEEKAKIVQQSEPFLLSLSVKIAEKIIKAELQQNEDQKLHIVKQALRHIEESEDVVLQVSPEDYPILLPFLEELKTYIRADSELKLIPVANVANGGCMIHTASGSYDVTVDGQLKEIKKQLLAYCEETHDELKER